MFINISNINIITMINIRLIYLPNKHKSFVHRDRGDISVEILSWQSLHRRHLEKLLKQKLELNTAK